MFSQFCKLLKVDTIYPLLKIIMYLVSRQRLLCLIHRLFYYCLPSMTLFSHRTFSTSSYMGGCGWHIYRLLLHVCCVVALKTSLVPFCYFVAFLYQFVNYFFLIFNYVFSDVFVAYVQQNRFVV